MRHFLLQSVLLFGFWCNSLQCAEIITDISYSSQINSQFDSAGSITGDPAFDKIHTPLPTEIKFVISGGSSIHGTIPHELASTLEFDPATSFINTTDNGITYTFIGDAVKATAHAVCSLSPAGTSATCVWDKSFSLPLTLVTRQNGITINQQNLLVSVIPGGGNNDTNQYSSLSGHVIFDESVVNYTGYEPETTGIVNLRFKWTVTVTEDTEGDTGTWNGSLVLNNSPASTIHRSLPPDIINASFSPDSIIQSSEIAMTGAQNNAELMPIYLFHDTTTCDDTSLCNYSLNNTSTTIICHDKNAQLFFNRTCNASATTQCKNGEIGTINGTWGHINIDTICAVTVTIPYE